MDISVEPIPIEYYFERELDYKRLKQLEKDFEIYSGGMNLEDLVTCLKDGWSLRVESPIPQTPFLQ